MPRYKVEKCQHYNEGGKQTSEWYEVSVLTKKKQFWLFGPLIEKWKVVKETLGSSGGPFTLVKRFYTMDEVNLFIKRCEEGVVGKTIRTFCFEGLGA